MRVAHINVISELSTGRIMLGICETLQNAGHAALVCHSRGGIPQAVPSYRVGSRLDTAVHLAFSRIFDCAGFLSRRATKRLVHQLTLYRPDIVHLHNLHGYYLNLPVLMEYLKNVGIPVVWTLHDCWPFTGHCAHYSRARCDRFLTGCHHCPNKRRYPKSYVLDRSKHNWLKKRELFTGLHDLTLAVPSQWLAGEAQKSFLGKYPVRPLPSGIDLNAFRPAGEDDVEATIQRYRLRQHGDKPIVLSAASTWTAAKGINDLIDLQKLLKDEAAVVVVGLTAQQREYLPPGIIGVPLIFGADTLRALYTAADVYISLSYEESQGLTLIEALACGTQVLCYNQTALPEIVTGDTGAVVPAGEVRAVADACRALLETPKSPDACRARAFAYDQDTQFTEYLKLYEELLGKH